MNFSNQMTEASYDNIGGASITNSLLQSELTMLDSTSASMVRIDIGYDAWLNNNQGNIAKLNNTISLIQTSGGELCIADASAESYRNNPIPWSAFKTAWVNRVTTLAGLYHPYCYIVVKEPGWYAPMISDSHTNPQVSNVTQWVNLTQSLINAVKSVSPNTKIGFSVGASSLYHAQGGSPLYRQLLQQVDALPGISFIGFDIYNQQDFNDTQGFLNNYGSGGKQIWIAEAWSSTTPGTQANTSREQFDSEWAVVLYYFAQKIHASTVSPFYTNNYASYQTTITSSYYSTRTPLFYEYQNVIANNKAVG